MNTSSLGMTPETLRAYDRRHGLLALLLLALLVLLPLVAGIGPNSWREAAAPAPQPTVVRDVAPTSAPTSVAIATPASAVAAPLPEASASAAAPAAVAAASAPDKLADTAPSAAAMVTPALAAGAGTAAPAPTPTPAPTVAAAGGDKPASILHTRLTFANARHQLPPNADRVLVTVAARLKSDPGWKVVLTGFHSKGQKSAAFNQALARKRSEEVAARLRALGVPADRIEVVEPVQTVGSGPDSEARRVEIDVRP